MFGRTLGLLGYGNIGQEVVARAHGFGMPVLVWSRRFSSGPGPRGHGDEALPPNTTVSATPEDVASRCDILSIHLALNAETKNLVGASILDRLKPGAYVINTARAEVVDYKAL